MNRVRRLPLDETVAKKLQALQKLVDDSGSLASRVERGKSNFEKMGQKRFRAVRETLRRMCPGIERCMFCEDSVGTAIEHFLPKALFPSKALTWENYLLACARCNGKKSDSFAAFATAQTRGWQHCDEDQLLGRISDNALLNPADASIDTGEVLWLNFETGALIASPLLQASDRRSLQSLWTVDLLDLNRAELARKRRATFRALLRVLPMQTQDLTQELDQVQRHVDDMDCPFVWEQIKRQWQTSQVLRDLAETLPASYVEAVLAISPKHAT
jgi:hypothetical protein